jgi:hypothetical protein
MAPAGSNEQQISAPLQAGAPRTNWVNYSADDIEQWALATQPGKVAAAGDAYTSIGEQFFGSISVLYDAAKQLAGVWKGRTAQAALAQMEQMCQAAHQVSYAAGMTGSQLQTHGNTNLAYFKWYFGPGTWWAQQKQQAAGGTSLAAVTTAGSPQQKTTAAALQKEAQRQLTLHNGHIGEVYGNIPQNTDITLPPAGRYSRPGPDSGGQGGSGTSGVGSGISGPHGRSGVGSEFVGKGGGSARMTGNAGTHLIGSGGGTSLAGMTPSGSGGVGGGLPGTGPGGGGLGSGGAGGFGLGSPGPAGSNAVFPGGLGAGGLGSSGASTGGAGRGFGSQGSGGEPDAVGFGEQEAGTRAGGVLGEQAAAEEAMVAGDTAAAAGSGGAMPMGMVPGGGEGTSERHTQYGAEDAETWMSEAVCGPPVIGHLPEEGKASPDREGSGSEEPAQVQTFELRRLRDIAAADERGEVAHLADLPALNELIAELESSVNLEP